MPTPHPRQFRQSAKLLNVRYDVRGPILEEAQRMEAAGHRIMKLNIGNPAPFGFEAPDAILQAMYRHLPHAQGYSDSQGIYSARTAVSQYYESRGIRDIGVEDVFIGNGVSEMITMVLQALVDDGDEIIIEPWRADPFPVIKDLVVDRSALDRIIAAEAQASGAPEPIIEEMHSFPRCFNDPDATAAFVSATEAELGSAHVHVVPAVTGSEDVGAFADALGDKAGLTRFGSAIVPLDEVLVPLLGELAPREPLV